MLIIAVISGCVLIRYTSRSPASPPYDADMPILMYHDLNDGTQPCNSMTVTAARMEADLRHGLHELTRFSVNMENTPEAVINSDSAN